jgi:hypothetical protein
MGPTGTSSIVPIWSSVHIPNPYLPVLSLFLFLKGRIALHWHVRSDKVLWEFEIFVANKTDIQKGGESSKAQVVHPSLNDSSSSSSSGACNMTMLFDLNGSQVIVQLFVGRGALIQTNNTLLLLLLFYLATC